MNWLDFVATIVDSLTANLAWPVMLGFVAFHFGPQVKILLGKMRSFESPVGNATFDSNEELAQAETEYERSPEGEEVEISTRINEEQEELLVRINRAWEEVKNKVSTVVTDKEGSDPAKVAAMPFWFLLDFAARQKLIDSRTFHLISSLQKVIDNLDKQGPDRVIADNFENMTAKALKGMP